MLMIRATFRFREPNDSRNNGRAPLSGITVRTGSRSTPCMQYVRHRRSNRLNGIDVPSYQGTKNNRDGSSKPRDLEKALRVFPGQRVYHVACSGARTLQL
jgi:hypothetical protein